MGGVVGKEVSGYRIEAILGRGGMGVVYKAEQLALGRPVALKRIDPAFAEDPSFLRRFRAEARALGRVRSPHIVQVYDLRETEIGYVIVMEYVDGGTVKDRLQDGPMAPATALGVIDQTLQALGRAHAAGVIHRDIKPHNILLAAEPSASDDRLSGAGPPSRDEALKVKVTDFGLAKVTPSGAPSQTVTQGVYGTLNYMSPEQVQGVSGLDRRSDLYAVGMTLYEMLAGRLPFEDGSSEYAIMRAIVEEDLPPLRSYAPEVAPEVAAVVEKALAKAPGDRYQTAAEMRQALQRVKQPRTGPRTPAAQPPARDRQDERRGLPLSWVGRTRMWMWIGLVVLGVAVTGSVGYLMSGSANTPPQESVTNMPAAMQPLVDIRDREALLEHLNAPQDGTRLYYTTDASGHTRPDSCYVFVLGPDGAQVEAVLGPNRGSRLNLRTGDPMPQWLSTYAGRDTYWVAVPAARR